MDDVLVSLDARRASRAGPAHERAHDRVSVVAHSGVRTPPAQVTFERAELDALLHVYSFKVADGEWRDYAIDFHKDRATFCVYRRASEAPLFRIEKNPKLARRQGAWSVVSQSGQVLKRGHELKRVLEVFRRRLRLVE